MSFSHAILHIDGDAFFAACEQARNPKLKGLPVITGKERGIAASMSYEAKRMGVTRAMPLWQIKKLCPGAVILPSDYETYSILSERMYSIVRRYTSDVEEYGIDECFADLTGLEKSFGKSYLEVAKQIQHTLFSELGFSFSIGLAPNKVLAKVASKWNKPCGLTYISQEEIDKFLCNLPCEKIWGIGPATAVFLQGQNIHTALEFARQSYWWARMHVSKPFVEIWRELRGEYVMPLSLLPKTSYDSIQKFKTFTPPSRDRKFVFAQVCKNIENACLKARRYDLSTSEVFLVLRTQEFRHFSAHVELKSPTNMPNEIIRQAESAFQKMFRPGVDYRATGVTLWNLSKTTFQPDLFGEFENQEKLRAVFTQLDKASGKYGKHTVFLGSSFYAHKYSQHAGDRGDLPARRGITFRGETKRKRLGIPEFLGEVG